MTAALTCEQLVDLAPEFALDGLDGTERAAVLAHLVSCGSCQAYVDELATVADRLLLLAPEDEPPPGFETRVLAAGIGLVARARARSSRLWRLAAAAAIVIAVSGAAVVGASIARRSDHNSTALTREYVLALQRLGGRSLRGAPLLDGSGQRVGQAFIYDGRQSWVFVAVDRSGVDGTYTVVCTGSGAGPLAWPGLRVSDGRGAIGWTAQGDVRGLDTVRLVDDQGHAPYQARLDRSAS